MESPPFTVAKGYGKSLLHECLARCFPACFPQETILGKGFPGAPTGKAYTVLSGNHLVIPKKASQAQKNAGFIFANWVTSGEGSLRWAEVSGYMPGRYSAMQGEAYEALIEKTPAYEGMFANVDNILPQDSRTYYATCTQEWMKSLALIFCEGAPVEETLKECAETINEILEDL